MLDPGVGAELLLAMPPGEPPGGTSMRPGFEIPLIFAPVGALIVAYWTIGIVALIVEFIRDTGGGRPRGPDGPPSSRTPHGASQRPRPDELSDSGPPDAGG